ncbi:MAG TPA: hypothetical protein VGB20_05280 [bacterium]
MARSQDGKAVAPLLGVLAALAIVVAGVAIMLQMREREQRLARERQLELVTRERDELQTQLASVQREHSRLEEDVTRLRTELTESTRRLAAATEERETMARSIAQREQELAQATGQVDRINALLADIRKDRDDLKEKLARASSERDEAQDQLAELQETKSQLEASLRDMSGTPTVELQKVVVGDRPQPRAMKAQTAPSVSYLSSDVSAGAGALQEDAGQVLVVNREYDFVVMDVGRNHGLSVGQEFQIVRGEEVLGRVKVEKVYDDLSAAAILGESYQHSIREGDFVRSL